MYNNSQIKQKQNRVLWITQTALVAAIAIILSVVDSSLPPIPIPIPHLRLGLSNIAPMFACKKMGLLSALLVTVIKSSFVGLTRGGFAFIISLIAGLLSTLVAYAFINSKGNYYGWVGIGVVCANIHNIVQLFIISIFTDFSVFVYLPVLLITGVITGAITGFCIGLLLPIIERIKN